MNEIQAVCVNATAGEYTLSLDGQATATIPFDASAQDVKEALEGTMALAGDDVGVTMYDDDIYIVEFTGNLAGTNVSLLVEDESELTGTVSVVLLREGS
jgi:hypothetical protein